MYYVFIKGKEEINMDRIEIKGKVNTAICYAKVVENEAIEQIRRMCDAVGLEIHLLKRIAVGNLSLGHLQPGEYRPLTTKETEELLTSVGINPATKIIKKPQDVKKSNPAAQKYAQRQRKSTKSVYEKRFLKQFGDKKKKK